MTPDLTPGQLDAEHGPEHPCVTLEHPSSGEPVEVDELLAPLVSALWRAGGATFASCQGDMAFVPLTDQRMRWGVDRDDDDALTGWDAYEAPVARARRAYLVCDWRTLHLLLLGAAHDARKVLEADPDDVPLELIVQGTYADRFLVQFPAWAIPVLVSVLEGVAPTTPRNRAQRRADARAERKGRRS